MKLVNHRYESSSLLCDWVEAQKFSPNNALFIQIFASFQTVDAINEVRLQLQKLLPHARIIGTSTAGIISHSAIEDRAIVISCSIFTATLVESCAFTQQSNGEILDLLESHYLKNESKLMVMFANTFRFDASELLQTIANKYPKLVIAGGNSGDDFQFQGAVVFNESEIDCDLVCAVLSSDHLTVNSKYLMNWQPIGQAMRVTKSAGSKVFTINNKPVIEIYRHYLGHDIAEHFLELGSQFPLVFNVNGVDIARAIIATDSESGGVIFAGNIPEGTVVHFACANIEHIENENRKILENEYAFENEAAYIYSCASRRLLLGNYLNDELGYIHQIAPTCGFITYGEFYHSKSKQQNNLLNITTTFVILNELQPKKRASFLPPEHAKDKHDVMLKALTTLISKTSAELEDTIYNLEQVTQAVQQTSIYSTTDARGMITDVNAEFERISGFSREELLGSPHNIVRSKDMPRETFADLWATIKSKRTWKGHIKNKRKDGSYYHVIALIVPIFYKNGQLKEYMAIRHDVTELEEYKQLLKNKLEITTEDLKRKIHYTEQYEDAINSAVAILKTDKQHNISYVNTKFCEISGYSEDELIGVSSPSLCHPLHQDEALYRQVTEYISRGESIFSNLQQVDRNGHLYAIDTLFYPLKNSDGEVVEILQVMNDITEITNLNHEIIQTQKEIIITMSAIGELRSQETGQHVIRVAEYCYLLAKLAGLNDAEANLMRQAAPMHDIGKIGIPDSILKKNGKLTQEEFIIMKTHTTLGFEMLRHSKRDILKTSAIVANTHHEKWDGSGYPNGLIGEEISIYGRITAIADVFDALGHARIYKEAWALDKILAFFKAQRGKHFDPHLVDLLFENLDDFLTIWETFVDLDIETDSINSHF